MNDRLSIASKNALFDRATDEDYAVIRAAKAAEAFADNVRISQSQDTKRFSVVVYGADGITARKAAEAAFASLGRAMDYDGWGTQGGMLFGEARR